MSIEVSEQQDKQVISLSGKIMGGPEAGQINDQIHALIEQRKKEIIIDLKNVEWMNSSGLGILIGAITTLRNNGGNLCLIHVSDRLQNLLKITKLSGVFDIYPDLDTAVKSM